MKSLGRIPTDPVPHSLVRDCHSCRSKFSLSVADLDNSFSMSKAAICSRLPLVWKQYLKKRRKHWNNNVLKEDNFNYKIIGQKFQRYQYFTCTHSFSSVIASKMSAEGFSSPSWIILVLSS